MGEGLQGIAVPALVLETRLSPEVLPLAPQPDSGCKALFWPSGAPPLWPEVQGPGFKCTAAPSPRVRTQLLGLSGTQFPPV